MPTDPRIGLANSPPITEKDKKSWIHPLITKCYANRREHQKSIKLFVGHSMWWKYKYFERSCNMLRTI
jgi:hypothetical protein